MRSGIKTSLGSVLWLLVLGGCVIPVPPGTGVIIDGVRSAGSLASAAQSAEDTTGLTPEQRSLREQAVRFNAILVEGQAVGRGVGAGVCIGLGGAMSLLCRTTIQQAGREAAYWVAHQDQDYADRAQALQKLVSDAEQRNHDLERLNATLTALVAADNRRIQEINTALAARQLSTEQARQQLAVVSADRRYLYQTLLGARERKQEYVYALARYREQYPNADVVAYQAKIEQMDRLLQSVVTVSQELSLVELPES